MVGPPGQAYLNAPSSDLAVSHGSHRHDTQGCRLRASFWWPLEQMTRVEQPRLKRNSYWPHLCEVRRRQVWEGGNQKQKTHLIYCIHARACSTNTRQVLDSVPGPEKRKKGEREHEGTYAPTGLVLGFRAVLPKCSRSGGHGSSDAAGRDGKGWKSETHTRIQTGHQET